MITIIIRGTEPDVISSLQNLKQVRLDFDLFYLSLKVQEKKDNF